MTAPQTYHPDVLIVGAGVAGIGAAMGLSGKGLDVLVLEKNAFPGGAATAAYVSTICGLYLRNTATPGDFAMDGIVKAFAEEIARKDDSVPVTFSKGLRFLPYGRPAFLQVSEKHLQANARVFYESVAYSVEQKESEILAIGALVNNKEVVIRPRAIIDCSGEAVIGRLAEHPLIRDDAYQAGAQVFAMSGLQGTDDRTISLQLIRAVKEGMASGALSQEYERVSMVPGSLKEDAANFKIGLPLHIGESPESHALLHAEGRRMVGELSQYLISKGGAFEKAKVSFVAPYAGIRTGPRYLGRQVLQDSDVLDTRQCEDGIALGAWPIEIWPVGESVQMQYFEEGKTYTIPAGCLESGVFKNLRFAGRHISATEGAIGSARVIATAMATGIAAGMLTAGALKGEERTDVIRAIQKQMKSDVE